MRELLLEIWSSVRRNRLRTVLTGFSVAWGIFMLVILLGSGNGLKNGMMDQFGDMAVNTIELYGGRTSVPYKGYDKNRRIRLTNADVSILSREFAEVDEVGARGWFPYSKISYGSEFLSASLVGIQPELARLEGIKVERGRFINATDVRERRKVIVLDGNATKVLFRDRDPVGERVKVGGTVYTVAGVYKSSAFANQSRCYIPLSTAQMIYSADSPYIHMAMFSIEGVETDAQMQAFESRLRNRIAAAHGFDPADKGAIWVYNNLEGYKNARLVLGGITLFVWIIGMGTLLAGIVGVSNIMLVTVRERTSEFGIRKALGAKPRSIVGLILLESVLITALFGYVGMVLGVGVMEAVNFFMERTASGGEFTVFRDPTLDLSITFSATLVLVLAGLVAGYVPARRAAHLKTIDALRYNK